MRARPAPTMMLKTTHNIFDAKPPVVKGDAHNLEMVENFQDDDFVNLQENELKWSTIDLFKQYY